MSFNIKSLHLIAVLVVMAATCFAAELPSPSGEPGPDPAKLVGRWLRADGGYLLQLTDPGPNGQLQAAYFNPKPINVARAAWKHEEGYLGAFVELRAPNYPGSTYTLAYDPASDRLVGLYFQAAMQQQFDVEFKRTP
jgi:hypothetical protein